MMSPTTIGSAGRFWYRVAALAASGGTFKFRDIDAAGKSGYVSDLFRDSDHLNRAGARVLSQELMDWIATVLDGAS